MGNNNIELWPQKRLVECFSQCFTNVEIVDESDENTSIALYKEMAKFVKSSCSKNVKQLLLLRGKPLRNGLFANAIRDILNNVEEIEFSSHFESPHRYDNILKHCRKLKKIVFPHIYTHAKFEFPQTVLPELEYIECTLNNESKNEIGQFLQRNPSVKTMVCHLLNDNGSVVKKIVNSTDSIDSFVLNVMNGVDDLDAVITELKEMDKRKHPKCLELRLSSKIVEHKSIRTLASLQSVTGLYFQSKAALHVLTTNLFDKLQTLQLHRISIDEDMAVHLAQNLPNLETLYYDAITTRSGSENHMKIIEPFVSNSKKLKKIIVRFFKLCSLNMKDIERFNVSRAKLKNAHELNIYASIKSLTDKDIVKYQNNNENLVKIKPVVFWFSDSHVKSNPMTGFSYTEI